MHGGGQTGVCIMEPTSGSAPAVFIIESIVDHVAKTLNMDVDTVKKMNFYKTGEVLCSYVADIKIIDRSSIFYRKLQLEKRSNTARLALCGIVSYSRNMSKMFKK